MDFVFDEDKEDKEKYFYKVKLSDVETNKVFYDKFTFIYLEMPKFTKPLAELNTHFERWMYVFKNLDSLQAYPESLTNGIFKSFFAEAELAQLPLDKQREYENSLKYYRDLNNVIDTAFDDGKELGKAQGIELGKAEGEYNKSVEIAKNLLSLLDNETIAANTGLSVDIIQSLRK
ncbi:PD-(D/E)XK nuclease family transposase [Aliivibrio finisterrensis]|uniref:PD-(D/E)XK nuclease family transposase n=2 Tax=Aliivibrio finisterrensis TaxID=511998 RepID=UPI0013EE2E66|nr:PD-(D/E)XK nuclease family transposase [Aliivibrio finisterrensis]